MLLLEGKGNGGLEDVIHVSIEQTFGDFLFITQILCVLRCHAYRNSKTRRLLISYR